MDEQRAVLDELCAIAEEERVDAVLLAGDVFDSFNPPVDASDLCYFTLKRLSADGRRPVIVIAGNHDSPDRIEMTDPIARACGIIFVGYPQTQVPVFALDTGAAVLSSAPGFMELKLPGHRYPLRILTAPYANEVRLKRCLGTDAPEMALRAVLKDFWQALADRYCDSEGVNILLAHLLFLRPGEPFAETGDDERPILHIGGVSEIFCEDVPQTIQYAALGHIHGYKEMAHGRTRLVYCGSPLPYSMAETDQVKKVCLIHVQPGKEVRIEPRALTKGRCCRRIKAHSVAEALPLLADSYEDYVELTLITDRFLTAEERRQLSDAHRFLDIIPDVRLNGNSRENGFVPDITLPVEMLFRQYFTARHGQEPGENYLDLFRHVLGFRPGEADI